MKINLEMRGHFIALRNAAHEMVLHFLSDLQNLSSNENLHYNFGHHGRDYKDVRKYDR